MNLVIFDLDGTLIDTIGDLSAAVEYALSEGGYPGHTVDEYRNMVGHGIRNLVTRALPEGSSDEVVDLSLSRFVKYYTSHIDVLSRPYPGIPDLLGELSAEGYAIAVASNKFQEGAEILIRRFFPNIPFVKILGNAPGLPLKPDPEVVRLILREVFAGSPPDLGRVHSRFALRPGSGLAAAEYGLRPVAQPADVPARSIPTTIYPDRARSVGRRSRALPEPLGLKSVMVGDSATDIKTARNAGIPAVAVSWGFRPRTDLEIADAIADTPEQLLEIIRIFTTNN